MPVPAEPVPAEPVPAEPEHTEPMPTEPELLPLPELVPVPTVPDGPVAIDKPVEDATDVDFDAAWALAAKMWGGVTEDLRDIGREDGQGDPPRWDSIVGGLSEDSHRQRIVQSSAHLLRSVLLTQSRTELQNGGPVRHDYVRAIGLSASLVTGPKRFIPELPTIVPVQIEEPIAEAPQDETISGDVDETWTAAAGAWPKVQSSLMDLGHSANVEKPKVSWDSIKASLDGDGALANEFGQANLMPSHLLFATALSKVQGRGPLRNKDVDGFTKYETATGQQRRNTPMMLAHQLSAIAYVAPVHESADTDLDKLWSRASGSRVRLDNALMIAHNDKAATTHVDDALSYDNMLRMLKSSESPRARSGDADTSLIEAVGRSSVLKASATSGPRKSLYDDALYTNIATGKRTLSSSGSIAANWRDGAIATGQSEALEPNLGESGSILQKAGGGKRLGTSVIGGDGIADRQELLVSELLASTLDMFLSQSNLSHNSIDY